MSYTYRLGQSPMRLFILGQLFFLIAFAWKDFPVFIFIAFAPIFALVDHPSGLKDSYLAFLVVIGTALIFSYHLGQVRVMSWIIYFTLLAVIFVSYIFMQWLTQNGMNKFALILFVMGMEYVLLKFAIEANPSFLADLISNKPEWTRWNTFTGYTGSTLWILLANLIFYTVLFGRKKINLPLLLLGILLIVAPVVYSLNLTNNTLVKADMINFYTIHESYNDSYSEHGELISRTGAWVSVLIIIFTLVKGIKGRTKKVLR